MRRELGVFPAEKLTAGVGDRQYRSGNTGNTFDRPCFLFTNSSPLENEPVRTTDATKTVERHIHITRVTTPPDPRTTPGSGGFGSPQLT